ncbi:hypothetical protein [Acinetobacter seifertii]|uniref:hypothetical protein n=1 Tax=Acinetobacter seifertii TaxID=1530123 RepID=UPI003F521A16
MRTSLQLFPEIKIASVETLTVAHSEANNELADVGALLLAIELSLVEKLKDLDLSKLAFDKTLRLIEIAKSNVELAQDFHNGALSEITGSEHQFDELKNSIAHLDLDQDAPKVNPNHLASANAAITKTLTEGFTHDKRR